MKKEELEEKLRDLGPPPPLDAEFPTPAQVYAGLIWCYDFAAIVKKWTLEHKSLGGGR